ncbi:MAG: DUF6624 domain-containing protein, partial [Minisyncoccia bacterium]
IDKLHTTKMKQIIKKYGWPTIFLVGKKASNCAWLLVQHADHDIAFQKKCLKLIEESYQKDKKSINPSHIAYLTDRILFNEGKKQIFGTQFYFDQNKKLKLYPLKSTKNIDKLRKKYQLPPLKTYIKIAKNFK